MPRLTLSPQCLTRLLQAALADRGTCTCSVEDGELIVRITRLRIWRLKVSITIAISTGPGALAQPDKLAIQWRLVRMAGVPGFLIQRLMAGVAGVLFRRMPFVIRHNRVVLSLANLALAGRKLTDLVAVEDLSVPARQSALAVTLKKARKCRS